MQTHFSEKYLATEEGKLANQILRSCVHCGFCTATCPTYQLLGDELDGPRGRIYLVKQMLEGQEISNKTLKHLDQCLECRSCETTCPSGVEYSHLLAIGRSHAENKIKRSFFQRLLRKLLLSILPFPGRFSLLLRTGQVFRPVLPRFIKKKVPKKYEPDIIKLNQHAERYVVLEGCVQPALSPGINHSARKVLDTLNIELISLNQCCGAIQQHLSDEKNAATKIKQNIDHLLNEFSKGAKGLIVTASGCGAMFKEYPHLMRNDPEYLQKAIEVANKTYDLSEIIDPESLKPLLVTVPDIRIAIHTPCTLQHALKLPDTVETIFSECGFNIVPVHDKHLCCGSAGTYSITQSTLSARLRTQRLRGLQANTPDIIATANIGCLHHLDEESEVPVKHWIEVIANYLK